MKNCIAIGGKLTFSMTRLDMISVLVLFFVL